MSAYPEQYRAEIVARVRAGESPHVVAQTVRPCGKTIKKWVVAAQHSPELDDDELDIALSLRQDIGALRETLATLATEVEASEAVREALAGEKRELEAHREEVETQVAYLVARRDHLTLGLSDADHRVALRAENRSLGQALADSLGDHSVVVTQLDDALVQLGQSQSALQLARAGSQETTAELATVREECAQLESRLAVALASLAERADRPHLPIAETVRARFRRSTRAYLMSLLEDER